MGSGGAEGVAWHDSAQGARNSAFSPPPPPTLIHPSSLRHLAKFCSLHHGFRTSALSTAASPATGASPRALHRLTPSRSSFPPPQTTRATEARARQPVAPLAGPPTPWRIKSSRTYGGVLAVCVNAGVAPPDAGVRALQICGIDVSAGSLHDPRKVVAAIGRELEARFVSLHGSRTCDYRQCLDPTGEQVQRTCRRLRRDAGEDNLLLHYSGHGVPAPSALGELWFFNEVYTEYVPARVVDVAGWLGAPRLMLFDCSCSERVVDALSRHFGPAQRAALDGGGGGPLPLIALGATSAGERLPASDVFPADVFSACLTRPLEMAVQLAVQRGARSAEWRQVRAADVLARLPGTLNERRSPLGELNWILTGITDAIAWALLPQPLFSRLFRQDVTLSAVLRNFVLAARVMWHLQCVVVSEPALPACHAHPLWEHWERTVDACLAQPHAPAASYVPTPFFAEQLTAFKLAIDLAAKRGSTGGADAEAERYLPVVLQALLSQSHRMRAMSLLRGFLCLGPWAVQRVLDVGIFQYLAKLLNSSVAELRSTLLHVWAVLLSHDASCQVECFKANGHGYFAPFLRWRAQEDAEGQQMGGGAGSAAAEATREERVLALLVYGALCSEYAAAQDACHGLGLAGCCAEALFAGEPVERRWALWCLAQLAWGNTQVARALVTDKSLMGEVFGALANDAAVEVRAAAAAVLGALLGTLSPEGLAEAAFVRVPEALGRYGELHSAAESAWAVRSPRRKGGSVGPGPHRWGASAAESAEPLVELALARLREALLAAGCDASPQVRAQVAHVLARQVRRLEADAQRQLHRCLRLLEGGAEGGDATGTSERTPPHDELALTSRLWCDPFPPVRQRMREAVGAISPPARSATPAHWAAEAAGSSRAGPAEAEGQSRGVAAGEGSPARAARRTAPAPAPACGEPSRVMALNTSRAPTHAVAMHPRSPLALGICGGADRLVCVWDARSGVRVNCFASGVAQPSALELLDGTRAHLLLAHSGGVVQHWSNFEHAGRQRLVSAWDTLPEPHERGGALLTAVAPAQRRLLTAGSRPDAASTIRLWDLERAACAWVSDGRAVPPAATAAATCLCLDQAGAGHLLGLGLADGSLALHDSRVPSAAPPSLRALVEPGVPLAQLVLLPSGGDGHVVVSRGSVVRCTDTRRGGRPFLQLAGEEAEAAEVRALALHHEKLLLATAGPRALHLHQLSSWSRASLEGSGGAACIAFSRLEPLLAIGRADEQLLILRYAPSDFRAETAGGWTVIPSH